MARRAPAYVGNLIPGLIEQGLSANKALEYLKSQGLGVKRQTFLRLYGATKQELAIRSALAEHAHTQLPGAEHVVQVQRPRARGYQYNVDILVRDPESASVYFTPTSVISSELISFGEAVDKARELLKRLQHGPRRDTFEVDLLPAGHVLSVLERVPEIDEEAA